jgi:hypothetical protein
MSDASLSDVCKNLKISNENWSESSSVRRNTERIMAIIEVLG